MTPGISLVLFLIYLIPGFFVARRTVSGDSGEIFGIFMFIWPLILGGVLLEKGLKRIGLYHVIFKYVYFAIIALIVTLLLSTYAWQLLGHLM